MYRKYFKRPLDFLGALFLLIILSPLLLVVAVWLHFANKGAGAFFLQERPGKDAKIFNVIKFKSMTDERDKDGNLLPNKERLTPFGRFVRASSLDELPQLINVIKGDMALIGPRPLFIDFLPLYDDVQIRRHEVRPGITGWAQVHGRNLLTYSKKFELDVWYVDHLSLKVDLEILFLTIKNVLTHKDIGNEIQTEVDDLGWDVKIKENRRKSLNSKKI